MDETDLNIAAGPEIFVDPFTVNFSNIWNFFRTNYKTDLDMDKDTYYRFGNNQGVVSFDKVYSIDNLLLYKTLLKGDTDALETFDTYLKLQESQLWYQDSINQNSYGFVRAVDNTTGDIFDDDRYLIDNLMPIFLLIENIGDQISSININSIYPKDSIDEIFNLINSSQFWDDDYKGFYNTNSSTDKYTESNLYSVLALLEIHRIYEQLGLNIDIKNRAYELANITMNKLVDKLWDNDYGGFEYYRLDNWDNGIAGYNHKYLQTNALGIITLLEYWKESGMQSDSSYFKNASVLFNKMEALWDSGFKAYEKSLDRFWTGSGANDSIGLEANSVMMSACLKLFEYTGNLTYYDRAWELYNTFENSFYDVFVNSYKNSIDPVDNNKNFHANLKLCEAYLNAFEIYSNTQLTSEYNTTSEIPDFIFNQDVLNITSVYSYRKTDQFYNITTKIYESFTIESTIESTIDNNVSITYIFKNPENEILATISHQVTSNSTTFLYNITDAFEIGQGYSLQIFVNSTNFGTSHVVKQFNIISGLVDSPILGLPEVLYQGPVINITVPINNTRNRDVNLTISMEGIDIISQVQNITFNTLVLTNVTFNLTATLGATIGAHTISFIFSAGNITYLEITKIIDIGHSFDYSNFIYQNTIVNGVSAFASLTLINFLPNSTQKLNVSFYEDGDLILRKETHLIEDEIKTVNYDLDYPDTETHILNVTMKISKGDTDFYSEQFNVEIIAKFEIVSASFPETILQGSTAQFILIIQNNLDVSESFILYVNGVAVETNLNGLGPGINRMVAEVIPSINPYDFGKKSYTFEIKDSLNEPIVEYYFEVQMELSSFNLVIFYILPVLIPISIILIYKNKEIKNKMLRR
ncbi:MAG: hypothetical protein ACTSQR_02400 [Promethearchaeota archaeon]